MSAETPTKNSPPDNPSPSRLGLTRRRLLKDLGIITAGMAVTTPGVFDFIWRLDDMNYAAQANYPKTFSTKDLQRAQQLIQKYETDAANLARTGEVSSLPQLHDGQQLQEAYRLQDTNTAIEQQRTQLKIAIAAEKLPLIGINRYLVDMGAAFIGSVTMFKGLSDLGYHAGQSLVNGLSNTFQRRFSPPSDRTVS